MEEMPQLRREVDYVVADGPGSNTDTSRTLLLCADLAIVPCKASMLEVRALNQATSALRHARSVRRGRPPAILVLSMVGKNYRLTKDMHDVARGLRIAGGQNIAHAATGLCRRTRARGRRVALGRPGRARRHGKSNNFFANWCRKPRRPVARPKSRPSRHDQVKTKENAVA